MAYPPEILGQLKKLGVIITPHSHPPLQPQPDAISMTIPVRGDAENTQISALLATISWPLQFKCLIQLAISEEEGGGSISSTFPGDHPFPTHPPTNLQAAVRGALDNNLTYIDAMHSHSGLQTITIDLYPLAWDWGKDPT